MAYDLPSDRVRIRLLGDGRQKSPRKYTMESLPAELVPRTAYRGGIEVPVSGMRGALEELAASNAPTVARTYKTEGGSLVSVWYAPQWTTSRTVQDGVQRAIKERVWPPG